MPLLVGNPLYHWAHLELRRYFGVDEVLSEKTAPAIWEACNAKLAGPGFGARELLERMDVRAVCTTDDPADSLEHHRAYAASRAAATAGATSGAQPGGATAGQGGARPGTWPVMAPTFRPDKALALDDLGAWKTYLSRLGAAAGIDIRNYKELVEALGKRHEFFHSLGCRASDHALVQPLGTILPASRIEAAFAQALAGSAPAPEDAAALRTALLLEVGRMNSRRGWAMQLHFAAIRNLNTRSFASLGPDTGYDAAGDAIAARPLALFLDALDAEGSLPKVVLYSLNPHDYEVLVSIMGCFQDGRTAGKLQLGSAWWFNDHIDGMQLQLRALANGGLLGRFVGMLTDSRSFLSFPRHEYFRRILCGLVGGWIERGEAPADFESMGALVRAVSYDNARDYFSIPGVQG
jgi:glucuronate isomerase